MAKMNPALYLKQVKSEMSKVTWPSRKETTQSVIAVFIMVTLASIFLFLADQLFAWVISMILNVG